MWTENKSGHMGKKSLAACDSSEEEKLGISSSSESEEDEIVRKPKSKKKFVPTMFDFGCFKLLFNGNIEIVVKNQYQR